MAKQRRMGWTMGDSQRLVDLENERRRAENSLEYALPCFCGASRDLLERYREHGVKCAKCGIACPSVVQWNRDVQSFLATLQLRRLRVWHWLQVLDNREKARCVVDQHSYEACVHNRHADCHIKAVQSLNDCLPEHYPTAEQDAALPLEPLIPRDGELT